MRTRKLSRRGFLATTFAGFVGSPAVVSLFVFSPPMSRAWITRHRRAAYPPTISGPAGPFLSRLIQRQRFPCRAGPVSPSPPRGRGLG